MKTRIVFNDNSVHIWEKSFPFLNNELRLLDILDSQTKEVKKSYYLSQIKDYQVIDETTLVEPRTAAGSLD